MKRTEYNVKVNDYNTNALLIDCNTFATNEKEAINKIIDIYKYYLYKHRATDFVIDCKAV